MIAITFAFFALAPGAHATEGCGFSPSCAVRASAPDLDAPQVRDPACEDDNSDDTNRAAPGGETGKTGTAR